MPSSLSGCPELVSDSQFSFRLADSHEQHKENQTNIGEIYRFRARNYYLYMMICLLLLCRVVVLLTLILTLCFRSSLLQSQTANLATLPSLTARPVPILSLNVTPILLASVITSTPQKTNNTSIIKKEAPSSTPGYDYGIYTCKFFLLYREN